MMARRNLNSANAALKKNIERLSTGQRINSAADDAAGLAVSEGMEAKIRSLEQGKQNANDGVSMLETAEGALGEAHGILNRMKELATSANTDAISSDQRNNIQDEYAELQEELNDIAADTQFNDTQLIAGTFSAAIQVGNEANDTITVNINQGVSTGSLGSATALDATSVGGSRGNASAAASTINTAISQVSELRASVGAQVNRLDIKMDNISTRKQSLEAANSRIRDTNIAKETAELTQNRILTQAGTSMLSQANSTPQTALSLLQGG
jgi:flagellin